MNKPHLSAIKLTHELHHVLGDISDLHPMTEGEESRVFGFRRGDDDFILRVNREIGGFRKDDFIHRTFGGADLPIPEITAIGHLTDGNAYCVSRQAMGRTLQDLSDRELPFVLDAVAQVMAAIAHCDPPDAQGFGLFDASGIAPHASWRDFLLGLMALDWDGGEVRDLLALFEDLARDCPEQRALVHGDFGSNNVLTDGRRVTAVIDWSEALYGDPLYELANILFWRPWLACMEFQARWFEAHRPELLDHRTRLRCYQLHIGLGQFRASALAGHDTDRDWALARCAQIARTG